MLIKISSNVNRYVFFSLFLTTLVIVYANFFQMDLRLAIYFPIFAAGVFMAKYKDFLDNTSITIVAFLLAISVAISFKTVAPFEQNILNMPLAFFGPLFFFMIAIRREKAMRQHKSIELISYASFFMYLFHRPVFKIMHHLYFPATGAAQIIYLVIICLPLIVAISWVGQKTYDALILNLKSNWPRTPKTHSARGVF